MKIEGKFLFIIILLMLLGFSLRIQGFYRPHWFTFDERVYTSLSCQLNRNPFNYSSKPIYNYYINQGRYLPDYLNKPLFKHPPLFCYLGSAMQKLTNKEFLGSYLPSLFFGLALIPLVFCVASQLFNKQCGILAAFLVTLDPTIWLCSQKIWLETIVTFFMFLAFYFLIKATINEKSKTFFFAGVATGLAMLSKMSGVLILFFALGFIAIYKPALYKKKSLWIYLVTSFAIYSPWIIWNYIVYRDKFVYNFITIQGELSHTFYLKITLTIIAVLILKVLYKYKDKLLQHLPKINLQKIKLLIIPAVLIIFINPYMLEGIFNSLNLYYIPKTGWAVGIFCREPALFYLRRLVELSPFYLIALLGMFAIGKLPMKYRALYAWSFFILGIFIIHGNYQSRYILPATPALLILAAAFIIKIKKFITTYYEKKRNCRIILFFLFALFILFFFIKTLIINLNLSLANNMAYF